MIHLLAAFVVAHAYQSFAHTNNAQGSCPSYWTINSGKCLWPKQQAYKNITIGGYDGLEQLAQLCCGNCALEEQCVSWLVYSEKHEGYPPGTCILNNHFQMGTAPDDKICASGKRSLPPAPAPSPAPEGAKNVLFFAVDDLRPEITSFGNIPGTVQPNLHTPNFDKLAGRSLVLTKNYVQQAVCSPTRTSILTGRRPDTTRVYDLFSYFRTVGGDYTTIPEYFKLHGYKTIGMGKIFHPGHASGSATIGGGDDGCCSWSNASAYFHAPNLAYWSSKTSIMNGTQTGNVGKAWYSVSPEEEEKEPLPDNQTANHAIKALRTLKDEYASGDKRPFFLAVGFHKPHLPFVASEKFFEFYPGSAVKLPPDQKPPKGMPEVAWSNYGELRAYADQAKLNATGLPGTVLPADDVIALRRAYYAAVTQTDDMLGKVMEALYNSGFNDNTIVSIWGDHGWQLGEHGEWCKHTNFELATRAPMIIHVPGLTDEGIVVKTYTEHIDLFPTLTEAAFNSVLPVCPKGNASRAVKICTEGTSLIPLMKGAAYVKEAAFSQYPRGYIQPTNNEDMKLVQPLQSHESSSASTSECIKNSGKGCTMGYTVITQIENHEYRYTEWAAFNTEGHRGRVDWLTNHGVELYNHSSDPGENLNLNATEPRNEEVLKLSKRLSAILRAGPTYGPM